MNKTAKLCLHCQNSLAKSQEKFCCVGCDAAYKIITKFGFESYYQRREINYLERKIKPEIAEEINLAEFAVSHPGGFFSASLMIQGLHCAACVWLIESILKKKPEVLIARVNLSKKTLFLKWKGDIEIGNQLAQPVSQIGYRLLPFDEEILRNAEKKYSNEILRALAVAGFGAGNIMLFSLSLWFSHKVDMGIGTRGLLHFFSALVALPVIIYSSRPFFKSAFNSIKLGYPNIDLAISTAIFLACIVSLLETFRSNWHVYFDSAVMLIFFLLVGRYLDLKARKKAFAIATEFSLLAASFGRVFENGKIKILPAKNLCQGMILLVSAGEKIAADGLVVEGESEIDTSLISGESLPKKIGKGEEVFAGMINLGHPLKVKITKSPKNSLLAEIIQLTESAENKKSHYIRIADQLSKFYLPTVHILGLLTFLLWQFFFRSTWEVALLNATAVLIITCPCALALAVPIVQTIAISNLIKKGVLVKSGEALEKLHQASVIVFDKTGSLTIGQLRLVELYLLKEDCLIALTKPERDFYLKLAASLAKHSRHPISSAILESFNGGLEELRTQEDHGFGLSAKFQNEDLKLGRREFCDIKNDCQFDEEFSSCFMKFGKQELIFLFADQPKEDAPQAILQLKKLGKKIILLSGDNKKIVSNLANKLSISEFYFDQTPLSKMNFLAKLSAQNQKFAMIGDGVNDAPALASSDISISFSKAADISQNVADIVIQGQKLMPIVELLHSSKKALKLMRQNLLIALIYNLLALPFAIFGHILPLAAAIAMSSSSLLVLFNSLRMNRG